MPEPGTLILLCGKMAAGKSTLARALARERDAILLAQDEFLERLYPGEITDLAAYVRCWTRITSALTPVICELLERGLTVVLDFPGNTSRQRAWFRQLLDASRARHELHFVDVPDELCKRRLRERSRDLPAGSAWTSDAEFDAITAFFEPPSLEEGFVVVRHDRG